MSGSLKDRVGELERKVSALEKALVRAPNQPSWRTTFGTSAGDDDFEEMIRLAREIRDKQRAAGGPDDNPGH